MSLKFIVYKNVWCGDVLCLSKSDCINYKLLNS